MKLNILITILGYAYGIDLRNRDLSDIPSYIPANETNVILFSNRINIIRKNAFVNLTELRILVLDRNDIETIEPGGFSGLGKLRTLRLGSNKLTIFPSKSVFEGLLSLIYLSLLRNRFKVVDTRQLETLSNLQSVILSWISPTEIIAFPTMPKVEFINFQKNNMEQFSHEILKRLSGLRKIWFGYNKLALLPKLGGVEDQIRVLDLKANRFLHVPDLSKYANLAILDLSENYITLVPEQSLSYIQSGTVNLEGNPVTCVSELCWLVSGSWPFEVRLTCPDGTPWSDANQTVICEGMANSNIWD